MKKEELNKILDNHKKYIESDGKEGEKADLSGADLRGLDLRGVDLRGVDLSGADLSGADLRGAYLNGSTFPKNTDFVQLLSITLK